VQARRSSSPQAKAKQVVPDPIRSVWIDGGSLGAAPGTVAPPATGGREVDKR